MPTSSFLVKLLRIFRIQQIKIVARHTLQQSFRSLKALAPVLLWMDHKYVGGGGAKRRVAQTDAGIFFRLM